MKKMAALLSWLCLSLLSCGPKEIGQSQLEPDNPLPASAVEQMRTPTLGSSNTQKMLYYINRPEVMEYNQKAYLRHLDNSPENPAYRAVPKQRSPFRQ